MTCLTHDDLVSLVITAAVIALALITVVMLLALAVRHLWPRPCACRRRHRRLAGPALDSALPPTVQS